MEKQASASSTETRNPARSRRHAIALMLGASRWLSAAPDDNGALAPLRVAISQSLVSSVNLNDARTAFVVWWEHLARQMNITADSAGPIFETTAQILNRVRTQQVDAVAINILEYRQMADFLDASEVVAAGDDTRTHYLLLVKRESGIQKLADLRGRKLLQQNSSRMCLAPAWLSVLLEEADLERSERFFGPVTTDPNPSRVVLPVFFGQAEACLVEGKSFLTMCELNPQLSEDLSALTASARMTVTFYVFRKNYHSQYRERLIEALSTLDESAAGRQLMTMFQFESLAVRDASCLDPALALIEASDRIGGRPGARDRKG